MPMYSLNSIKTLETRRIKRFPAKIFTNVGMVQRVIKNRARAPTHHTGNKSPDTRRVPCQSANQQPLQVTIHRLQETLHTLHPGQHSQASRHSFEAVVTIPTSGNMLRWHAWCKAKMVLCHAAEERMFTVEEEILCGIKYLRIH